jgi:uncharacterized linocin/CFP29 family protein
MENAVLDLMTNNGQGYQAFGGVAQRLLANGMDIRALRPFIGNDNRAYTSYLKVNADGKMEPAVRLVANATLRFVEWKQYDEAVIREARQRLVITNDLIAKGCVYNIANGMAKTVLESENIGEFNDAELSMDGLSRTAGDRVNFGTAYLPLPITHKDYSINARVLAVSRNMSEPLDTTSAELATRKVAEKIESMIISGTSSYSFGGATSIIYGLTDYPYINTVDLAANWDASGVTAEDILADVLAMKEALRSDRFYGPFTVYIAGNYSTVLDKDYFPAGATASTKTVRARILEIEGISDVKVVDTMTDDTVLMVQTTPDVIRIVNGMEVAPVEWQEEGGMVLKYKVMGIKVPQIRSTQAGRCGICYLRAA